MRISGKSCAKAVRLRSFLFLAAAFMAAALFLGVHARPASAPDDDPIDRIRFGEVRLLMERSRFEAVAGRGQPLPGCIGCAVYAYFPKLKLTVSVSDGLGTYKHRVTQISTKDRAYRVLDIGVGDSLRVGADKLSRSGLTPADAGSGNGAVFAKGDFRMELRDYDRDGTIDELWTEVADRLPESIVR
jgi:hypothetical protein